MAPEELESIEYGGERRALVFADGQAARERQRRAAEQAGYSVAAAGPIEGAAERLQAQIRLDAVLIEADHSSSDLEQLLAELETRARERRNRSVVTAPEQLIDLVFAAAPHRDVIQLCRPNSLEIVAAAAAAGLPVETRFHDGRENLQAVLQQLSDEAARIAGTLATLIDEETAFAADDGDTGAAKEGPPIEPGMIRAMIRARRLRDTYFKGGLFADPAWDMLLDLMAARLEQQKVAVSSLCIAAAVPPTTALRWIKTLTDKGLLVRRADPADGRRVYIELSDDAARALTAYIRAAQRISPLSV